MKTTMSRKLSNPKQVAKANRKFNQIMCLLESRKPRSIPFSLFKQMVEFNTPVMELRVNNSDLKQVFVEGHSGHRHRLLELNESSVVLTRINDAVSSVFRMSRVAFEKQFCRPTIV